MEAVAAAILNSVTLAGPSRGFARKMDERKYNPVQRALFWLLAGFLFSSCGATEPSDPPVLEGSSEIAAPAVEMITHTPRPTGVDVANVDTGSEDQAQTLTPAISNIPVATMIASPEPVFYEVQAGDWMAKIARQFGLDVQVLMEANPAVNPQYLQPGAQLVLPITGTPSPQGETDIDLAQESGFAPVPDDLESLAKRVFGSALPLEVIIPVIGIEASVIPVGWHTERTASGTTVLWHSPGSAAGFLVNSAAPGSGGNAVFYGHHNVHGSVFRGLDRLQPGDMLSVRNAAETIDYVVEQVDVFEENSVSASQQLVHMQYFAPTSTEHITLLTCWPFTGNSHRVAVIAKPIE